MLQRFATTLLLLFTSIVSFAQTAKVHGVVKDDKGNHVSDATVAIEGTATGTQTNNKGRYNIEVTAGQQVTIVYNFVGYDVQKINLQLKAGDDTTINISLKHSNTLKEVTKTAARSSDQAGGVHLDISKANDLPSTVGGVEGLIKTYVGSHNELTSQYSVRGGNYDENLVYVNDFEIYRPFLVRTGQQEGLSFVNTDLVSNVFFSVGGFQPKYGDKMSSVLDVTYKRPTEFSGSVMLSLLGGSLHLEGASKNKKLTYLLGARQKSDQYLLQAQPTKGQYNPSFTDIQALINYRFNDKWEIEAIGNYARNRFTFFPESEVTSFGVVNQAYQLRVFYNGSELDQFDSRFGGFSTTWRPNDKLRMKLLISEFQTQEKETYDISGEYLFGELQTDQSQADYGQIKTYLGTGLIQDFARNYLNVSVTNIALRGSYDAGKHFLSWGLDGSVTNISDNLHEWERRDSSDYNQPNNAYALNLSYFYNSNANFNYQRYDGFIQDNFRIGDSSGVTGCVGARVTYSQLNGETDISPRFQLAYKPHGDRDIIFKFATGIYDQPPFYREMRDMEGNVNKELKSQKSGQVLLGTEYNFKMYNRPFKVTAEVYYKDLWDMDPYIYDNVRIRYTGKNDAIGYVYGGEVRLYGDLVKDATSWISIGMLKGMQKLTDSAQYFPAYGKYFPLPDDQRFMLGMYLEDYLPRNKNFKVHLNLLYASGLPVNPPYDHLYQNSIRIPDYKRVDIGFSALILDAKKHNYKLNVFKNIWGSFEVFNLLGIQNTLSYSWIQDQSSGKTFAVPNRLTSRLYNVKLIFRF